MREIRPSGSMRGEENKEWLWPQTILVSLLYLTVPPRKPMNAARTPLGDSTSRVSALRCCYNGASSKRIGSK